jgi:3-isopropylmalate dehydrogenase
VAYRLGVLEGDGIGPEIVPAATDVVDAAVATAGAAPVDWVALPMGHAALASHGDPLPPETLDTLGALDGWLLGPHDSVSYPEPFGSRLNPSGTIRKHFDLFANIRPARALPGANAVTPDADLVIVRENTQGFYADRNTFAGTGEWMPTPDVAISQGVFTRAAVERLVRVAFELAERRRRHLTVVHKANVLRRTTGMFLEVVEQLAPEHPEVTVDDHHIDAMTAHLVRGAGDFDVLVTENMFGDILSDLTGALAGSLGVAPSINASSTVAMAQASHGSAPDIAGQGLANPMAMILSAAMLLDWMGGRHGDPALTEAAHLVETGVEAALAEGTATPDLGGSATTSEFATAAASTLKG